MLSCDCPTCKPLSKLFRSHELEPEKDFTVQASTSVRVTETSNTLMNFDYEPVEQSEATVINNQMTGKPKIEIANIGYSGHLNLTYITFSILSCLILLHFYH
ncbi:hypothetical protein LOAG_15003 [Loa loa]|uniref:Uncharacterized protein n=1 Tax=Loa loa TaxID=7209 RepID=A0A1S0TGP9_LOALO|nr:hypothetical protein LOAG_15003 [Loa loa]EFO13525.1 hypothetical protein LOAG_15003 [Loa loa]